MISARKPAKRQYVPNIVIQFIVPFYRGCVKAGRRNIRDFIYSYYCLYMLNLIAKNIANRKFGVII